MKWLFLALYIAIGAGHAMSIKPPGHGNFSTFDAASMVAVWPVTFGAYLGWQYNQQQPAAADPARCAGNAHLLGELV